jgi:long-chain acyl-CoA synthetase
MVVQDFLQKSAADHPNKLALLCGSQSFSYSQLDAMSSRLANALLDHGLRRGERVVIYLPNTVEAVVGVFAALKAGGVFVIVNRSTKHEKLKYIIDDCQAAALLLESRADSLRLLPSLLAGGSLRCVVQTGAAPEQQVSDSRCVAFDMIQQFYPAQCPPRRTIDLDLACLIYTSGSTGYPKAVMSDHSNVDFASSSIIEYLQSHEDDRIINVLPLAFDYGLYQLLMAFKIGGTLVLERGFTYPAEVLRRIEVERVTGLPGVPTIFAMLLQMDLSAYDLSSLRYLSNTAASLPPSHILALRRHFPQATLYSMYGLTETKRTLYLPPEQLDRRPGSVGIPIPGTEVWLEDEAGRRCAPGETGELVVRGRHVMRGYWNDPEASARRFRPGPLPGERVCYTGDLFRSDDEGYLYFVGRSDDIIKSRGEKVAPREVENVLYALPGVVGAAVVAVPDAMLGSALKAFIVCKGPPLSEAQVLAHCRAHLEDFMVPRLVEFRDQLPTTDSGKIRRGDLVASLDENAG